MSKTIKLHRHSSNQPHFEGIEQIYDDATGKKFPKNHCNRMEWGYGGGGPHCLAFNILAQWVDLDFAKKHYRQFVVDFVSLLPREGIEITNMDEIIDIFKSQIKTQK